MFYFKYHEQEVQEPAGGVEILSILIFVVGELLLMANACIGTIDVWLKRTKKQTQDIKPTKFWLVLPWDAKIENTTNA